MKSKGGLLLSMRKAPLESARSLLLIAAILLQACLIDVPTIHALASRLSRANEKSPVISHAQAADSRTSLAGASLLVNEIRAAAYPELRGVNIQVKFFDSASDYFRAGFAIPQFLTGRRMRYTVFVNPRVFTRQAPETGRRAIIAHELAHVLYFRMRKRIHLLGLVRLASIGFTSRFERWADLQAIARGYGEGLKAYRLWLYQNIPTRSLGEKKRDYFSPEEIDAALPAIQKHPELVDYWLSHVPMNLNQILADRRATDKR